MALMAVALVVAVVFSGLGRSGRAEGELRLRLSALALADALMEPATTRDCAAAHGEPECSPAAWVTEQWPQSTWSHTVEDWWILIDGGCVTTAGGPPPVPVRSVEARWGSGDSRRVLASTAGPPVAASKGWAVWPSTGSRPAREDLLQGQGTVIRRDGCAVLIADPGEVQLAATCLPVRIHTGANPTTNPEAGC